MVAGLRLARPDEVGCPALSDRLRVGGDLKRSLMLGNKFLDGHGGAARDVLNMVIRSAGYAILAIQGYGPDVLGKEGRGIVWHLPKNREELVDFERSVCDGAS